MLNEVTRDMTNVIVVPFDGLLVEFAKKDGCLYDSSRTQGNHRF